MRKILVSFPDPDVVEFEFEGKLIKVKTYINLQEESVIIASYLEDYFDSEEEDLFKGLHTNFWRAELVFDMGVLDVATNIKAESKNLDIDGIYSSGLMDEVKGRIANLPQMRGRLERVVLDAKQERYSAKGVIRDIIDELTTFIKGLDFGDIQKLAKEVKDLESDVAESKIKSLMDEVKQ